MKRIQLQQWTTYEKLCLASAVQRTGDQNWTAVSRAAKNIFEESTKTCPMERRPLEWFSMKQCAAQYEYLLKNVVGPRRKKRTEKASDLPDSPAEIIINVLRQEYVEELKQIISEEQMMYLKIKKENEDIEAGLLDDKLEEMIAKIEAKEREKDIKIKLKFKLGEKHLENDVSSNKSTDLDNSIPQPEAEVKPSSATSPLLTSLLQSPSPLTRPSVPSSISLLLNSSPTIPSNESPTLSKLLESPSPMPSKISSIPQPQELQLSTDNNQISEISCKIEEEKQEVANEVIVQEEEEKAIKVDTPEPVIDDIVHNVVESEVVIGHDSPEDKRKLVRRRLDSELDDIEAEEEVIETVEQIIEKVEEAIIETVGETGDGDLIEIGLNQTLESENIEDHLESLELDHEAVELIVMGPNQGRVIAVRHTETTSSEQIDTSQSTKDDKDETENVIESIIENVIIKDISEIKEEPLATEEKLEEIHREVVEHEEVVVEEVIEETKSEADGSQDWIKEEIEVNPQTGESEGIDSIKSNENEESANPPVTSNDIAKSNHPKENDRKEKERSTTPKRELIMEDKPKESISKPNEDQLEGILPVESTPKKNIVLVKAKEEKMTSPEPSPQNTPQKYTPKLESSQIKEEICEKEHEFDRKKGGRKRTSLGLQFDSKPNSPSASLTDEDRDYRAWKKSILLVYNRLAAHKYASVFLKPITEAEAVGYHSIIRRPMDLTTIKRNIESGTIRTTVEFQRDMLLMVQNAIMYNKTNTLVFKMAHDMLNDMLAQMEVMVQAIGDGVPLRRELSLERLPTRGRSSKPILEETPKRKRTSIGDDSRGGNKRKKTDT